MAISIEQATVYRGGGRRWFSLKSAVRAEVRSKINKRCECVYEDPDYNSGYPGCHEICRYHEPERYEKIIRRLTKIYFQSIKSGFVAKINEGKS